MPLENIFVVQNPIFFFPRVNENVAIFIFWILKSCWSHFKTKIIVCLICQYFKKFRQLSVFVTIAPAVLAGVGIFTVCAVQAEPSRRISFRARFSTTATHFYAIFTVRNDEILRQLSPCNK